MANFRYALSDKVSKNPLNEEESKFADLKTGDYGKFNSQCDKTMVGFVQTIPSIRKERFGMTDHRIQCFVGSQETHYDMEKTVSVKTESDTVKVAVITSQNKIVTPPIEETNVQINSLVRTNTKTKRLNAHLEHKASN